ncbi:S41 family peptidase [Rubellicoccus peritrichatus]|uniref:S41 family peptidase n=1 Tax=Rubellicoccus peritrichatus TaxID=3080537 RepID=A0AAQ3L767_9BACT|nr:S41 family peptidase [Puniceicoccus sp. CR14]WOO39897.1 S41 family peptidase [Puniceicoccus sp. CR14]
MRVFLALLLPGLVFGFELSEDLKPGNGTLFPKEFFPDLSKQAPERIFLEGMVKLYPGRVLDKAPESNGSKQTNDGFTEELPRGITYVRAYGFESARNLLTESLDVPALIWDFRYVVGDYENAISMLELLSDTKAPDDLLQTEGEYVVPRKSGSITKETQSREYPVIILVNHRTRGAIEAALDELQRSGHAMLVGTRTAGATGSYEPIPNSDGFWVIKGSVKARDGSSLLGVGLEPDVPVTVTPAEDFTGYQLIENGSSAQAILRSELPTLDPDAIDEEDAEDNGNGLKPVDHIMQRAVDIIIALQVLGKLPDEDGHAK